MPSGPPELHEKWKDDNNAVEYLRARGYRLNRDWTWDLPHSNYDQPHEEFEAMYYLVHEWDYGGYSDLAKKEMTFWAKRPFLCKIGLHRFSDPVQELGPRTAMEMHERSGAVVKVWEGPWRTCLKCGTHRLEGKPPT